MSPASIQRRRLEFQCRKDGIPTSAPETPKRFFPSVPSILCMQHRNPISGYSKAPWGLSVLSRVTGIFTGTTISPGGLLRQCPDHYAFHAGQNLPDKEFRYLRTVIVTAAVHWGFNSMLAHLLLTFQHRAGVSPIFSYIHQSKFKIYCNAQRSEWPLTQLSNVLLLHQSYSGTEYGSCQDPDLSISLFFYHQQYCPDSDKSH